MATSPSTSELETVIATAAEECRNWGRWGPDDEVGTLNYVTPEKVAAAARLVQKGTVLSLSLPFDRFGPQDPKSTPGGNRTNPLLMVGVEPPGPHGCGGADDMVTLSLQCATHLDALSHAFDRGRMWNGYPISEVAALGAKRNGIEKWASKIVTRGVLLDLARFKGVDHLEAGYAITEEDILGCIESQGPTSVVGTGDVVLLRTGWLGSRKGNWGDYAGGDEPGLSFFTAAWLRQTEIAGIATDTWGIEVRPNEFPDAFQPLHQIVIPNIGLLVGENFDLDGLASDCASDGVYECLFVAAPIPFTGSVSGLVNPQAIK